MSEPASLVLTETRGAALVVTLNRADVKNALNAELVAALLAVLDVAAQDARVGGIVLTGAGADFCAGADLKELKEIATRTREENRESSRRLASLFRAIHVHPKPVVAAVRGHALAGGAGLACVCDWVVAAGDARFGFTEARIGFVAAIVARFLIERAGPRVARNLLLTARRVEADEALALGLADEIAAGGDVLGRALAWIDGLRACSPASLAATKLVLAGISGRDLDSVLAHAAELNAKARSEGDFLEGVAAFLEKRKPRWLAEP